MFKIENYTFKVGDKVEFRVYDKKALNELPVLSKTVTLTEASESVSIELTSEETKLGEILNKPKEYWYEIELNDESTVIGYDENGAKILNLYPEGEE